MIKDKEVILIRKQNRPYTVNYPVDGRIKKYVWNGTQGKRLDKKAVPFEVYDWLATYTTVFSKGQLIIENVEDEEIKEIKDTIENIEQIEHTILTKDEIEELFNKGNHLSLKKKLDELIQDQPFEVAENQKRYIVGVASEIGIDSNAKRQIICEWAGLNYENSDLIFDKHIKEQYED
ncbi:hypothetical protein ACR77J_08065 [Tissierella praeacuta]|uniref:hypothetical protein n=1 Tax=Tissierella praeacuta TaxID=43131 RepID=UPI003DA5B278